MAYKINGTTVVDNSRNVCACCVTSCCITASTRMDAPSGTTAQRPASPATGSIYFDTDLGSLVSYNGTDWGAVGGAGGLEIDEIATADNQAFAFMTVNPVDNNLFCKSWVAACAGFSDLTLKTNVPASFNCVYQAYQSSTQNTRYGGCIIPAYITGRCRCCCVPDEPCYQFLSQQRTYTPVCFMGFGNCYCPTVAFKRYVNGFDGTTVLADLNLGRECLSGYFECGNTNTLVQHFINRKGGITKSYQSRPNGCYCYCCAAYWHPYQTFPHLRYHGSIDQGAVAGIRAPISFFERTSTSFPCNATWIVTSDSFGTGSEELCCYAFIHGTSAACWYTFYRTGMTSSINGWYQKLDLANAVSSDGCMWCCSCYCWSLGLDCCCAFLGQWCQWGIMDFYTNKTDRYGGSNAFQREGYTCTRCTYADGVTLKGMAPHPSIFGITHFYGFEQCCYCVASADYFYTQPQNCRVRFLSRDGCYIHYIKKESSTHGAVPYCCCHVDSQYTTCPTCWGNYKRIYYSRINRITQCYDCFYGACCLCFPESMCALGCVKGSHCLQGCLNAVSEDQLFQNRGWYTPAQRSNYGMIWGNTNNTGITINCSAQNRTLEDYSWNAWSHVCTRKAIFHHFGSITNTYITLFDCCKELLERSINLYKLNNGCEWLKFARLYSTGPQNICVYGSGITEFCYLAGCCTAAGGHCVLANCICAITGNAYRGLAFHCLGYNLWRDTHTESFFGFVPTGIGAPNTTYINKANDHVVMFRAFKHDSQSCTCGCQFYWIGAICYDIHNNCISKVNTFFPSSIGEMQKINCCWYTQWCTGGCQQPLDERCMKLEALSSCGNWYTELAPCGDRSNHISAEPYGNYEYWLQSGCTDLGGVIITMSNLPSEFISAIATTSCCCSYYYNCTGVACNVVCDFCSRYMCVAPGATRFAKVPYTTPLECIGWRSEPILACWMNQWFFPHKGGAPSFAPVTTGDACHKLFICCMVSGVEAVYPCVKLVNTNNCFACQLYGAYDCNRGNKEFKIWKGCCCIYFCSCQITGATNGTWCPVTICNIFLRAYATCGFNQCIYDNVLPCHLDSSETSKRYASRFLNQAEPLTSVPYHVDKTGNNFFGCYIKQNTGEDAAQRFTRLWNEDVIMCC